MVVTKPMKKDLDNSINAREGKDYVPKSEKVIFLDGEIEKRVEIELRNSSTTENKEFDKEGEGPPAVLGIYP